MKYGIGIKEMRKCYDGKMHECTILDCSVILKGRTFDVKSTIKADGFKWWAEEKFWVNHFNTEEDISNMVEKYEKLGVTVNVEPNFRITDPDFEEV